MENGPFNITYSTPYMSIIKRMYRNGQENRLSLKHAKKGFLIYFFYVIVKDLFFFFISDLKNEIEGTFYIICKFYFISDD